MNPNKLGADIPMEFMYKVIDTMQLEKMNMLEICQRIYTSTYVHYAGKFWEEKGMREKLETKMLEKNKTIEDLEIKVVQMQETIDDYNENYNNGRT